MRYPYILFLIFLSSCSDIDEDIYFEYSIDTTNVEIGYPLHLEIDIKNLGILEITIEKKLLELLQRILKEGLEWLKKLFIKKNGWT